MNKQLLSQLVALCNEPADTTAKASLKAATVTWLETVLPVLSIALPLQTWIPGSVVSSITGLGGVLGSGLTAPTLPYGIPVPGPTGPQGPTGPAGTPGVNGTPGIQGPAGGAVEVVVLPSGANDYAFPDRDNTWGLVAIINETASAVSIYDVTGAIGSVQTSQIQYCMKRPGGHLSMFGNPVSISGETY